MLKFIFLFLLALLFVVSISQPSVPLLNADERQPPYIIEISGLPFYTSGYP